MQIEFVQLLSEERCRIAEELHDRVSPHLFGIVYAIHAMSRDWNDMAEDSKLEQMIEIQAAAAMASRELRSAIYNLSATKSNSTTWMGSVEAHLASQAKLNGVRIRFHAPGSDGGLAVHHQKALFRIIAEGVGNAIRHGASSIVDVRLTLQSSAVKLVIADNGTGFDSHSRHSDGAADSGFGLFNMRALATSMGGIIEIDSRVGSGTRIQVTMPLRKEVHEGNDHQTISG